MRVVEGSTGGGGDDTGTSDGAAEEVRRDELGGAGYADYEDGVHSAGNSVYVSAALSVRAG